MIGIHLEKDSTYEDDKTLSSLDPSGDRCLLSLSGNASGHAFTGGPGYVMLVAFGHVAQMATQPGMPSQQVEELLMLQLAQQGLEARPAQPADFTGFEQLEHDYSVCYIGPGSASSPGRGFATPAAITTAGDFYWKISDSGLLLDLSGMMYPQSQAAAVTPGPWTALRLDATPAVFGRGSVEVRFAGIVGAGGVRITANDISGHHVRTLYQAAAGVASGSIRWDGREDQGREVPSGVYFIRLETSNGTQVRRLERVS